MEEEEEEGDVGDVGGGSVGAGVGDVALLEHLLEPLDLLEGARALDGRLDPRHVLRPLRRRVARVGGGGDAVGGRLLRLRRRPRLLPQLRGQRLPLLALEEGLRALPLLPATTTTRLGTGQKEGGAFWRMRR